MVSLGVPSSLVMIQSAPPVDVMPWATMNSTAWQRGGGRWVGRVGGVQVQGWLGALHTPMAAAIAPLAYSVWGTAHPATDASQHSSDRNSAAPVVAGSKPSRRPGRTHDGHEAAVAKAHQRVADGDYFKDDHQRKHYIHHQVSCRRQGERREGQGGSLTAGTAAAA